MLSLRARLLLPLLFGSLAVCSPIDLVERAVLIDRAADLRAEYDYVVIGGGTSGLTVANRLTENPQSTVVLSRLRNALKRILIMLRLLQRACLSLNMALCMPSLRVLKKRTMKAEIAVQRQTRSRCTGPRSASACGLLKELSERAATGT